MRKRRNLLNHFSRRKKWIVKAIEVFDEDIEKLLNYIFDLLGMSEDKDQWERNVCFNIINSCVDDSKYREVASELICDWRALAVFTKKVKTHARFNTEDLLKEKMKVLGVC